MLVDTGATFWVIPPQLVRALGIPRLKRSVTVRPADGTALRLRAGVAVFEIDGREAPATILVGTSRNPFWAWKPLRPWA